MDWEIVRALGPWIGGLGTIAAVVVGFSAYERQQKAGAIASLREDARSLRRTIESMDRRIAESYLSNRGYLIAREIYEFSGTKNKEDFLAFLEDERNLNIIIMAVFTADAKDKDGRELLAEIELAADKADRNSLYFPVLSTLLRNAIHSFGSAFRSMTSITLISTCFRNQIWTKEHVLVENLKTSANMELCVAHLGDYFGQIFAMLLKEAAQARLAAMRSIANNICAFISSEDKQTLDTVIKNRKRDEREFLQKESDAYNKDILVAANVLSYVLGKERVAFVKRNIETYDNRPQQQALEK